MSRSTNASNSDSMEHFPKGTATLRLPTYIRLFEKVVTVTEAAALAASLSPQGFRSDSRSEALPMSSPFYRM